jgi:peptidoglycan/xylan/chitin deacetylase (PgdA/CDA1 family)
MNALHNNSPERKRRRFIVIPAVLVLVGLTAVSSITPPTVAPRSKASLPQEISRGPQTRHVVALTFDAGGETDGLPRLLSALKAAKIHCTFFLTGRWASQHPELAREIRADGHEIGNHTWSHPDLTRLGDQQVRNEILRNDALLTPIIGHSPRPLFRAPYGARDARVLRLANELGYTSIYWTLDSLDSIDPPKTPEFLISRVTGRPDPALDGAIVLMHVGEPATAAAVPVILADLQRRGFKFATVSELLAKP